MNGATALKALKLRTDNEASAKRALVVGLGKTGYSCAHHLSEQGFEVTVVDSRTEPPKASQLRRNLPAVALHVGGFAPAVFSEQSLLVVSPGVSLDEPQIQAAVKRGAEVVGDVELFARATRTPVVAVTGSNGKSTVTALVGVICTHAGMDAMVGGNIGVPVLELRREPAPDLYVLELSSFQLETTYSLKPVAATVLNVTTDHMDRYLDMDHYAQAKARIFTGEGVMVVNRDDPCVAKLARSDRVVVTFGASTPKRSMDYGLMGERGRLWLVRGRTRVLAAERVTLAGRHNLLNVLAAMALGEAVGVDPVSMAPAIERFQGLPHRSELVAVQQGVRWVNDSKATNVGATIAALRGMGAPVVLIAGGEGKGADFTALRSSVTRYARATVLYGRDAGLLSEALRDTVPLARAKDLAEAVERAREFAQEGDVVLLSPACASFDMFRDFAHRGEVFRQLVTDHTP